MFQKPDQGFDLLKSFSDASVQPRDASGLSETVQITVVFETLDTIPLYSLFCPISTVGSSFFLLISEKVVLEGDLTGKGIVYTESALLPCTFVKMDTFNFTFKKIL